MAWTAPRPSATRSRNRTSSHISDLERAAKPGSSALRLNILLVSEHEERRGDKPLFTRPSNGNVIYLRCYISGCDRGDFGSVGVLRDHVCKATYRHKLKDVFTDNDHAFELCGVVAPGQESPAAFVHEMSSGVDLTATMTQSDIQTPELTDSEGHNSHIEAALPMLDGLGPRDGILFTKNSTPNSDIPTVRELRKAYRTISAI